MLKVSLFLIFILGVLARNERLNIVNGRNIGKLVGNKLINRGGYPFITLLRSIRYTNGQENSNRCGGSIIRPGVVLTAAHCVVDTLPQDLTIYAGYIHTQLHLDAGQIRSGRKIIIHENYSVLYKPYLNDIAIVFLDSPFQITRFVSPIDPPSTIDYVLNSAVTAVGWGLDENGEIPNWLQKTFMRIISNNVCQDYPNEINKRFPGFKKSQVTDDMICALNKKNSTTCQGDSGSGLIYNKKLIGMTIWTFGIIELPSIGSHTCHPYYPAVFLKVANYVDWINSKL